MSYYNYTNPSMNYGSNYASPTYYTPQYGNYQQPQQTQPLTNKLYVTSVEDALSRFANPNTVTVYFLQDESTIFEVTTDAQGKKNYRARKLTDVSDEPKKKDAPIDYVTRTEFDDFRSKIEKSMSKTRKKTEEMIDDE